MDLALVTGSAGFIGTNLVGKLLKDGYAVIGVDNFSSSESWKAELYNKNPNYEFIEGDITSDLKKLFSKSRLLKKYELSEIYNLACPASPPRYSKLSLETIKVCVDGMFNLLELAKESSAKVFHSSTSEIYGDPLEHPQKESYRGNVNTFGPRSCYDEGKRISETICFEYINKFSLDIKIGRIFNTYGPYMDPQDGRVITNFVNQALTNKDMTLYGDGSQTRSFQYIDDLLIGIEKFMKSSKTFHGPLNLGNPDEFTIKELAEIVVKLTNSNSKIIYKDLPKDDPKMRRPNISLAKRELDWQPKVKLKEGLKDTISYYKSLL